MQQASDTALSKEQLHYWTVRVADEAAWRTAIILAQVVDSAVSRMLSDGRNNVGSKRRAL